MTQEQKLVLADRILEYVNDCSEDKKAAPKMIGRLNRKLGIKGFKLAEVGDPVWDSGDRYFIILENLEGTRSLELAYYKEDLNNSIKHYERK